MPEPHDDVERWTLDRSRCLTTYEPTFGGRGGGSGGGYLRRYVLLGSVGEDLNVLLPRGRAFYTDGWFMDVSPKERDVKRRLGRIFSVLRHSRQRLRTRLPMPGGEGMGGVLTRRGGFGGDRYDDTKWAYYGFANSGTLCFFVPYNIDNDDRDDDDGGEGDSSSTSSVMTTMTPTPGDDAR